MGPDGSTAADKTDSSPISIQSVCVWDTQTGGGSSPRESREDPVRNTATGGSAAEMDAGPLTAEGEGSSPEGETVCSALARYEATLRDAVREIHVDVSAFKQGVERRLVEATAHASDGPLGLAVAQLQQENRQLRSQLEALKHQVELLTGIMCDRGALMTNNNNNQHQPASFQAQTHSSSQGRASPQSPSTSPTCPAGGPSMGALTGSALGSASSPTATRFSSRATFAVSSKTNSYVAEHSSSEVPLGPFEHTPAPPESEEDRPPLHLCSTCSMRQNSLKYSQTQACFHRQTTPAYLQPHVRYIPRCTPVEEKKR
ncbi:uncharacterized protein ACWYII_012055 [Salvelinus alpinus]